jgi:hypothetical protein
MLFQLLHRKKTNKIIESFKRVDETRKGLERRKKGRKKETDRKVNLEWLTQRDRQETEKSMGEINRKWNRQA